MAGGIHRPAGGIQSLAGGGGMQARFPAGGRMDEKRIDLNASVYSLCGAYPEIRDLMAELGFTDILKPGMLQSAGRFMTLPRGAALRKIDLGLIKDKLRERGFVIME